MEPHLQAGTGRPECWPSHVQTVTDSTVHHAICTTGTLSLFFSREGCSAHCLWTSSLHSISHECLFCLQESNPTTVYASVTLPESWPPDTQGKDFLKEHRKIKIHAELGPQSRVLCDRHCTSVPFFNQFPGDRFAQAYLWSKQGSEVSQAGSLQPAACCAADTDTEQRPLGIAFHLCCSGSNRRCEFRISLYAVLVNKTQRQKGRMWNTCLRWLSTRPKVWRCFCSDCMFYSGSRSWSPQDLIKALCLSFPLTLRIRREWSGVWRMNSLWPEVIL